MLRIAGDTLGAPSVGVQVCRRALFPECATARKQTALKRPIRISTGGHGHAIRMVCGRQDRLLWHLLLAHAGEASSRPARFSINH
jgi:hypothetical protein